MQWNLSITTLSKSIAFNLAFGFLLLTSCQESMTEDEIAGIGVIPCRKPAPFIKTLGFDPNKSAFTTENVKYIGIILLQPPLVPGDTQPKIYQHPSWSKYGYMGSITTDDKGNAYTFPIPYINVLEQTRQSVNSLFKIDYQSGEMSMFSPLPIGDSSANTVAYGILGVYYDCHGQKIYASSVSGSTRDEEKGKIFLLDMNGKILDQTDQVDAMGLCVGGVTGEKKLYFGKARTSEIYTIELNKEGYFKGKPELALNMDQLGPRGDDKARRIRFNKNGNMLVHGIEFNFNLAGQSIKPETQYLFGYNNLDKKWVLMETK